MAWLALVVAGREAGLLPYLAKTENATALVRTPDDWRRVTAEAVADAAGDGLAAVELRFSPQFIAGMTGLDADDVIEAVSDAASGTRLPVEVGLIGIIVRDEGPGSAMAQARGYKLAGDLLDEASLDIIKENALAARFTRPGGSIPSAGERF